MKHFTLLLALICICISANSQNIFYGAEAQSKVSAAQVVRMGTDPVYPTYIQFSFGKSIPMSEGEKFMIGNFKTNGEFGLQLLNVETDQNQITQHYRYIQTESGVPVAGSMWIIHVTHGMITSMNGQLYSNKVLSNATSVSETVALQNALNFIGASVYKWQIPTEETFIKNDMNDPNATFYPKAKLTWVPVGSGANSTLALAYAFDIYAQEPLSRTLVSVDANTGIVIGSNSLLEAIDVNGIAHTQYSGTQTIRTDSLSPTSFRLREAVRGIGNGIETYNMHAGTNYGAATDFTDADNDWNNINANLDEYATDAHYASEMVYDYYYNTYGRNSIDGLGFKLKSYVHYDVQYLNAFWDGTRMSYGDGSTGYTPLTSLDIGGHEITHGLTSFTANLNYSYESGALNESFSDVLGETIQGYGTNWGQDWLMSANIGVPFRSFIDPNLYGQPDTYLGTNWATGPGDNGGVHTNSGVQNFWYYLLVNGGTGTNDNNNAYNVSGIGIIKAAAIAFRTLTVYLTPTSQYADARFYSLQAATDLFGACSNEVVQTANAWYAVGVGGVFVPVTSAAFTAAQTSYCTAPADVQFTNQSTNGGTFTWDFGDGTTSNAVNPLHTYTNYNTYDVKLVADGNSCGIDSVTHVAFINISTSNPCIVNLPTTGTAMTQTGCAGTIYDSGGPGANYGDNEDGTVTISPVGASSITLTFTQFSLENNYDYLYVYDGPTTASTLIGQYTGNALPNGGVINTNSGSVTIRMTSDVGVNQAGFTIGWQCTIPTLPPFVNFSVSPSTSCNGVISFDDNSSNGANAWTWNFGDGSTSNQQNPTHTYLNNGTYDVKLIACNNIGCDSLTQYAIVNIARPAAPATANASRCDSGVVTLSVLGTGNMYWYSDSTATNQVNVGSTYTTPGLNTTTTYYVQEHQSNPPLLCGPANHTFGTGGYYSNATDRYLIFSNTAPINLISVDVDAQAAGSRTIELRDAGNNVLQSLIVNLNAGWNTVTLNFALPVGTNLHLGFNGTANCYRNQSGAVFPYNATGNGPVSITGTNGNAGYYYFFYNWQLGSPDCISLISPVTAIIGSPSASTTPSGAISICNGQSLTITANNGNQYLWSTGDTTQSITVTTGGQYYVTVGDAFCSAVSDTVNLDILAAPVATVSPTGSVDACNGDTIQLQAFGGGTYTWSNGATDSIINVATTGNYSVIVSNGTCTDTSVGTQVNVVDVQAGFYTFFLNLGYTFVDTSSNATSWFWDLGDGTTSTSQNPAHMYTTTGAFTVTLIVSNGNCTDTATMLIDVIDGINSTSNTWIASLYPNPANNNFTLSLQGNSNSNIQFEVVNMLGQQIDLPFNEIAVGHLWNFNSESLSAGVYWVKVSVNNSSSYLKLVKE